MVSEIPPDVGQFILDRIDSIAGLEAVLLLRGNPDAWWQCKQVADRLYLAEESCLPVLNALCKQGLLLSANQLGVLAFRYRPESGDLREMVDRLAYYYSRHLVPVSNLVHAKSRARIEEFAQAFYLSPKD